MQPLEPLHLPLHGQRLIEASAGTGKTYTISSIYLRLLLEKQRPVDEVLVVTFTQAATEELRDRIRKRLKEALTAFTHGTSTDPFLQALLEQQPDQQAAITTIDDAIKRMDEVAVFTIHGFCQRVLQENAFESGVLFDTEFLTQENILVEAIVEDYWRINFYPADRPITECVYTHFQTPKHLQKKIAELLLKSNMNIIPTFTQPNLNAYITQLTECRQHLQQTLQTQQANILHLLSSHPDLHRGQYRQASIQAWLQHLAEMLTDTRMHMQLPDYFQQLTPKGLQAAIQTDGTPPEHVFFDLCGQYAHAIQQFAHFVVVDCLRYTRTELVLRKQQQGVLSFNDLLTKLDDALNINPELARRIRLCYPMAMIDEFQDTDPVQYRIFKTIYPVDDAHTGLFMIGDPKQAIYSFRGADVFTYIKARRDTPSAAQYTLDTNWRSTPAMVNAVNTLFSASASPFIYTQDIRFYPVNAAQQAQASALQIQGRTPNALTFTLLPRAPENQFNKRYNNAQQQQQAAVKAIRKQWAGEASRNYVANEIARLLTLSQQGLATLHNAPIEPKHFAILVQNRFQAYAVQQALREKNIATVYYSRDSVLNTQDAADLLLILTAITHFNREPAIRTALCTRLVGMSAHQLDQLIQNDAQWERWLEKFQTFYDIWTQQSFMSMFRHMLHHLNIPQHLLATAHGERHITNLLQLSELLQSASAQNETPEKLIQWLHEQHLQHNGEDENQQLRLESDDDLVKIITIHKSKGLEYDIVFLPFLWDSKPLAQDRSFSFHDPDNNQVYLDLGSEQRAEHYQQADAERLAEDLRLLYVALTRAKYQCHITWGQVSDSPYSALAYLLHQHNTSANIDTHAMALRTAQLSDADIARDITALGALCAAQITLQSLPNQRGAPYQAQATAPQQLSARRLTRRIDDTWRVTSYTALTQHHQEALEIPDYDQFQQQQDTAAQTEDIATQATQEYSIFTFPKGAKAGILMHSVFESIDFTSQDEENLATVILAQLDKYGFAAHWLPTLTGMVRKVLDTPLNAAQNLMLNQIGDDQRLVELEFYLPFTQLHAHEINHLLSDHLGQQFRPLSFESVRGMLKGFIDLLIEFEGRYYIIDYKSNYLGADTHCYQQTMLAEAMRAHNYHVQYLLYAVAVQRYLSQRIADYDYAQHFGGVFYLFLRGITPHSPAQSGIYTTRPDHTLLQALSALFDAPHA